MGGTCSDLDAAPLESSGDARLTELPHTSVLPDAVLAQLAPQPGRIYCDGTVGAGGHSLALLEAAPDARLVAVDRDQTAIALSRQRLADHAGRVTFVHGTFGQLDEHLAGLGLDQVDGVLLDLGLSSMQIDTAERGFSFSQSGPVDMRMDASEGETALDLIRVTPLDELVDILRTFGEERYARRIAARLKDDVRAGSVTTTTELADAISACIPAKSKARERIHPATRSFQALRIAVNRELDQLSRFLDVFPDLLAPGGRCVVISFHSLEDRMVKHRFRDLAWSSSLPPHLAEQAGERVAPICRVLTRKPVVAGADEIRENPRARSAKLRACEKVAA